MTESSSNFTRRNVLKTGAALAGASAAANLTLFAQAWAQASPFKPEAGAAIQVLRWKRFVQAEEDTFMATVAAFTKATGVEVKVVHESLDDVQPKASVAANTNQGPDMFWGLYSLPHLFPDKVADVTDVADYLGKKYGGWVPTAETYGKSGGKWIAIPMAYNGNVINYRSQHDREGRLQGDPEGHGRLPGADEGAEGEVGARAVSRSAAPRATATPGSTGHCGRRAPTWSMRKTRSSSIRPRR